MHRGLSALLLTVACSILGLRSAAAQVPDIQLPNVQLGKALFERKWQARDALSPAGDGVGPMRNATSCVGCHSQGGTGGGGPIDNNVDILTASPSSQRLPMNLRKIHPAFVPDDSGTVPTNIVVHRFGADPAYAVHREQLLQMLTQTRGNEDRSPTRVSFQPTRQLSYPNNVRLIHSQRNTPALFGAGLIDRIPATAIHRAARYQATLELPIRGQVPMANRKVGRFGWRGQTSQLHDFVLMACANELGLTTQQHHQAVNPERPDYKPPGIDLNEMQCRSLTSFIANLPAPQPVVPSSASARQEIKDGRVAFGNIGCAICHQQEMAHINGLYSDMLLHDMGEELADSLAEYYNSGALGSTRRQWRTPPLWGVRHSSPYLHDGRAATLMEAILLHSGEANIVRQRFIALPVQDRLAIIAFLNSM